MPIFPYFLVSFVPMGFSFAKNFYLSDLLSLTECSATEINLPNKLCWCDDGCWAGFAEDAGGGPESALAGFLHEGVGDCVFAFGCGGEYGDAFGESVEIFSQDFVKAVVFLE